MTGPTPGGRTYCPMCGHVKPVPEVVFEDTRAGVGWSLNCDACGYRWDTIAAGEPRRFDPDKGKTVAYFDGEPVTAIGCVAALLTWLLGGYEEGDFEVRHLPPHPTSGPEQGQE